ncbi:hypothetical protein K8R47_04060 [archaeon]|nr:hypothetical protein [archaeon]
MDKKKVIIPIFFSLLILVGSYFVFSGQITITSSSDYQYISNNSISQYSCAPTTDANTSNVSLHFWLESDAFWDGTMGAGNLIVNLTNTSTVTSGTAYTFSLNSSNIAPLVAIGDKNYTWGCLFLTNDGASFSYNWSTNKSVILDTQPPSTVNMSYPADATNNTIQANSASITTMQFEWTVIDAVSPIVSCNLTINNLEGGDATTFTAVNTTFWNTTNTTALTSINVPLLTIGNAGLHNYSITCQDMVGNVNSTGFASTPLSLNANFTINDTVIPTPGTATLSATSVTKGTAVTVTCAATDNVDANPVETVYYKNPGSSDYSDTNVNPYSLATDSIGTYTVKCGATDDAGNTNALGSESTITVTSSTDTDSPGGSGGSSSSSSSTTVNEGETEDIGDLTGTARVYAYVDSSVEFTASGESHSIHIDAVDYDNSQVTLTISSDPVTVTINEGETELVDLDGDGVDDLEITLTSISLGGQADLSFDYLEAEEPGDSDGETPPSGDTTPPEETGGTSLVWWIILIVIVIAIIVFLATKKKR